MWRIVYLVCNFFSCSKCSKIHNVIDESIEYWNFHSLNDLQTLFFIRFSTYPSYEFIQNEIDKDNHKYVIEMHSKVTLLYDKLFSVEFIHDMKYDVCKNNLTNYMTTSIYWQVSCTTLWIINTLAHMKVIIIFMIATLDLPSCYNWMRTGFKEDDDSEI